MTGIGGDMFCLFYNAKTKTTHALNGSGRYSKNVELAGLRKDLGIKDGEEGKIPMHSVHAVTVPGAAAGWVDTLKHFGSGRVTMEQVLTPAIELGDEGFPVTQLSSHYVRQMFISPFYSCSQENSSRRASRSSRLRLPISPRC